MAIKKNYCTIIYAPKEILVTKLNTDEWFFSWKYIMKMSRHYHTETCNEQDEWNHDEAERMP
jgi:hypothetical protein